MGRELTRKKMHFHGERTGFRIWSEENTLIIQGFLDDSRSLYLDQALEKLIKDKFPEVFLDLTGVTGISYLCRGSLIAGSLICENRGEKLTILLGKEIFEDFQRAQLDKILNIALLEETLPRIPNFIQLKSVI